MNGMNCLIEVHTGAPYTWMLCVVSNCWLKAKKTQRTKGPLTTDEIVNARDKWVNREQSNDGVELQSPRWKLIEDTTNGVLKCEGRIVGYQPIYLRKGTFVNKLISHVHNGSMHLRVARQHAWLRWQREYVHGLMEYHRVKLYQRNQRSVRLY